MSLESKYLKYKKKYLSLQKLFKQSGGAPTKIKFDRGVNPNFFKDLLGYAKEGINVELSPDEAVSLTKNLKHIILDNDLILCDSLGKPISFDEINVRSGQYLISTSASINRLAAIGRSRSPSPSPQLQSYVDARGAAAPPAVRPRIDLSRDLPAYYESVPGQFFCDADLCSVKSGDIEIDAVFDTGNAGPTLVSPKLITKLQARGVPVVRKAKMATKWNILGLNSVLDDVADGMGKIPLLECYGQRGPSGDSSSTGKFICEDLLNARYKQITLSELYSKFKQATENKTPEEIADLESRLALSRYAGVGGHIIDLTTETVVIPFELTSDNGDVLSFSIMGDVSDGTELLVGFDDIVKMSKLAGVLVTPTTEGTKAKLESIRLKKELNNLETTQKVLEALSKKPPPKLLEGNFAYDAFITKDMEIRVKIAETSRKIVRFSRKLPLESISHLRRPAAASSPAAGSRADAAAAGTPFTGSAHVVTMWEEP